MNRKPRKSIAYHEAGHAVIAHVLGLRVQSVTVGGANHCAVLTAGAATDARLYVYAAGPAAHSIYSRLSLDDAIIALGAGDHEMMMQLTDDTSHYYNMARRMCRDEWHAIKAVAELLLQRHNLTGDEIEAAILQAEASAA